MFVVIKKKTILIASFLLVIIALSGVLVATYFFPREKATAGQQFSVVLDAGHGGVDVGVKGVNSGVNERDVNMKITLEVKKLLEDNGIAVTLTRTDENGLYDNLEEGFKKKDFQKRKEIINNSDADCVISIHCNKFPDPSRRGAQCFFEATSASSIALTEAIQAPLNTLNERELSRSFQALKGDYYILKCSTIPSAIIECGFLSNAEDDLLLNDSTYIAELSNKIVEGILTYKNTVEKQ